MRKRNGSLCAALAMHGSAALMRTAIRLIPVGQCRHFSANSEREVVEALNYSDQPSVHARVGLNSCEEVAMRVMYRLCGLRELGNKKFAVPVLEHRFPLQVERDIERLPCPCLTRCSDAI